MNNAKKTIYATKIDKGIIIFILMVNCAVMYLIGELIPSILIGLFMLLIIASIVSMQYVVEEGKIYIKQLNFNIAKAIDISSIQNIEHRKSIISAPAGSTDRIELRCGKQGTITISPKDQKTFIAQLMSINPNIIYKSNK